MSKEPGSILNIYNKNTATMTVDEALAFIVRARLQIDESKKLPQEDENFIGPQEEGELRLLLDMLETTLRSRS